jgi:cytoskeletal protein CcmA (bactofilin family)
VKAGVALDGEQNEVLLNNSSGSGDSRDFDSIEVDQNSILARTGSDLDSFTIPSNSLLVRENSNLTTFSFGSNKVLATNSSSELQDVSVSSNSAVIRGGSGGVKSESIGTDQFLANTGSGLEATDLDSVQNKLDISAEDVSSGTFKSTGSGVTYTFNSTLTVEEDVTVNASVSISGDVSADSMTVGRVTIPSDSSIIRPTSGNELTIESGSGPEDDTSSITFTKGDSKEGISLRSDDLIVDIDKNSVTSIKTINSKLSREDRFDFRTDYFKTVTGDMEYKNSANNFVDAYTDLNTGVLNEFLEHGVYVTSSGGIVLPVFKNAAIQDNVKGTTDTSIFNEGLKPPKGHATIVVQEDSGSLLLTVVKDDGTEDGV